MTIGSIGGINRDGTGTPNTLGSTDFTFTRDTGKLWASVTAVADRTPWWQRVIWPRRSVEESKTASPKEGNRRSQIFGLIGPRAGTVDS